MIVGFGAFRAGLERWRPSSRRRPRGGARDCAARTGWSCSTCARSSTARPAGYPAPSARPRRVGRPARPRRARRPAARHRGDGGAEHVPRGVRDGRRRGGRLRLAAGRGAPLRARRGRGDARGGRPRGGAAAARLRARARRGAGARRRRGGLAGGARGRCAPPPARRWWRSRASATRGTASRAPWWPPRRAAWTGCPPPEPVRFRADDERERTRRRRRRRAARRRLGLRAQGRRRQPRRRQAELRRQVRLLPRPQARRHHRRDRAEPRRGLPARPRATASARAPSRASSTARSSSPRAPTQTDPQTGKPTAAMPAKLFTGEDAQDVAAYVASAVAKPGEDRGQLAAVGVKRSNEVAKAEGGKLDDPRRPVRRPRLHVRLGRGARPARSRSTPRTSPRSTTTSPLEGNGVDEKGGSSRTAASRGVTPTSRPASTRSSAPSPATAQGGMEGKLTVK